MFAMNLLAHMNVYVQFLNQSWIHVTLYSLNLYSMIPTLDHHVLPDILSIRQDPSSLLRSSDQKQIERSLVDDMRFSKRQYNLLLKRGIQVSYEDVSKSSQSNTRHSAGCSLFLRTFKFTLFYSQYF